MADEGKILFTVDAAQIVAKLHFAGLQAVRGDASQHNGFIVNTGIRDDNPDGKPDNIGKTRFDLVNKSGLYCAGVVRDFEFEMSFKLKNALTDIFKLRAKLYGRGKKLLDPAGDPEELKKFNEHVKSIKNAFSKAGSEVPKDEDFQDEEGLKKIRHDASNLQRSIMEDYEKQLAEAKESAAKVFDAYMKVFAGADNTENITKKNITAVQVSNNFKSVKDSDKFVKDFKIVPIGNAEREQIEKRFQEQSIKSKDPDSKVKCTIRMCFYVSYSLKVDEQ